MLPKIEIDAAKCTAPMACQKCLQICPPAVFMVANLRSRRLREEDPNEPGTFGLRAAYIDLCSGCLECVRVCPVGAISIDLGGGVVSSKPTGSAVVAQKASYSRQLPPMEFDLKDEMLDRLGAEFDPQKLAAEFSSRLKATPRAQVEKVAEVVFGGFGQRWMKRAHELGEKHVDRPYEILKAYASKTGSPFPGVVQRFIEIAYLGIHPIAQLSLTASTPHELNFCMVEGDCAVFESLRKSCAKDVVDKMPCTSACLSACRTILRELGAIDVEVTASTKMSDSGICEFKLVRGA